MTTLEELQAWFSAQCNGNWEYEQGIIIESNEGPGWWVKMSLARTPLQGQKFPPISENIDRIGYPTSGDWIHCYSENDTWNGAGDNSKLETILKTFLTWAKSIELEKSAI
jgi:hypothetical protein